MVTPAMARAQAWQHKKDHSGVHAGHNRTSFHYHHAALKVKRQARGMRLLLLGRRPGWVRPRRSTRLQRVRLNRKPMWAARGEQHRARARREAGTSNARRSFISSRAVSLEHLVPPQNFYRQLEAKLDLTFVYDWSNARIRCPWAAAPSIRLCSSNGQNQIRRSIVIMEAPVND